MNERQHFKRFKRSHRDSMALAQIGQSRFTKSNGHGVSSAATVLQEALHLPRQVSFWDRLFKPEILTLAGREVKGFVVPHWAAGVLLAAVIGCMGFMYNQISSQRDMMIRLDTQLQERDKHEIEYRSEFKNQLNVQKVYIDNMTNQLNTIKGLLTQEQMRMLDRNSQEKEQNHARPQSMPRM